ncbi:MAG: DUF362 domain-containing protein [Deltaproteobacteria bacterium]|nr:DUF362 domain-containing protein [Deltaproteobacteria bacterium]
MSAKVSIKKCGDYNSSSVYSAVKESIDLLGGIEKFVKAGERILIKPNLLAGRPPEAAVTTHPEVVRAVITLVREAGATPVVGDSPGLGTARKSAEKCGIAQVCVDTNTEIIEFKEIIWAENPKGYTFKRLEVAKEVLGFDGIINIPKIKTHAQMYLTLGVKNLFGCVPGKRKPQWHLSSGVDSLYFAGMLIDLYLYLNPRLTIMDGIVGMEGNGPGNGDPRHLGIILGSSDAIALDAVITELLGSKPHDLPILKAAAEWGIKSAKASNVTVAGEPIENVRVAGFKFPPLSSANFAARFPYFIDKRLRKALTSRPHINTRDCTLCSVCVNVCPAEVMKKRGKIIINYDKCIRCYCCQEMCPQGAITPREGWLKKLIPGF